MKFGVLNLSCDTGESGAPQSDIITSDRYTLYSGDSFTVIDELIESGVTINHIITDPPYNISHKNNFNTLKIPRKGVDFGEWDKNFDLYSWIPKYAQILDKNGSFIIFCSYRHMSFIIKVMEENNIEVKDILVWKKSNPMPRNIERRYVQDMEFAVWGVKKGAKWVFNKSPDKPYMRSLFETGVVSGKERSHPTQKSLQLMQDIINIHTNKNDVVLDPFMGSGTTGLACMNLNRRFIGVELDKEYFNTASNRLASLLS